MHLKLLIANAFWRYKPIRIWSKGSMHHLLRFWPNDCMTIVSNKTRSILLLKWRCHINHNSLNYNSSFLRTTANQAAKNYRKLNWVWDFSQHEMITINWSKAWTARPSTMVATICLILGNRVAGVTLPAASKATKRWIWEGLPSKKVAAPERGSGVQPQGKFWKLQMWVAADLVQFGLKINHYGTAGLVPGYSQFHIGPRPHL